jgi:hypothetical protein
MPNPSTQKVGGRWVSNPVTPINSRVHSPMCYGHHRPVRGSRPIRFELTTLPLAPGRSVPLSYGRDPRTNIFELID